MRPVHPGEVLKEDCMKPLGLSVKETAEGLGISSAQLSAIIEGREGVSPDLAVRLAKAFDMTTNIWLKLQTHHDLWHAERNAKNQEVREFAAAS